MLDYRCYLVSGPRAVTEEAFRMEKLAVTALGSIIRSEGIAGNASSLPPHVTFPLAKKPLKFSTRE